jgi:hypothetical protein
VATAAQPGQVITFYSYKGGTGRSMSLVNIACLLAERLGGEGNVLLIDWDLEAPGLHRFFPGPMQAATDTSLGLDHRPGLIDLFQELDSLTPASCPKSDDEAEARAAALLDQVDLEHFVSESGLAGIRLLRAGRDEDGRYSQRVTTFGWEGLFHRSPALFRVLAERWARAYRYVLVDSRTGVSDISGICTALLPDKLVVVFTPNRQSLTGIRTLVQRATTYRRQSDDLRPLLVFPLPSRIEATREDLRAQWRMGNRERGITGYQPMFEELLAKTYGLPECKLDQYFDQVQIQQTPDYAYGEEIAVRAEQKTDRFSLSSSYRVFTDWLVNAPGPWRRQSDVDTLIETLKERVGAGSLGHEQRQEIGDIVEKLGETYKRETLTTVLAPKGESAAASPTARRGLGLPTLAGVPAGRRLLRLAAAVAVAVVVLGGGVALWSTGRFGLPASAPAVGAPSLVGRSLEDAILALTNAGLKVGRTETQIVIDARPGTVLKQSPAPGAQVGKGSAIDLVVATPGRPEQ